jgi:DNA-binding MarR family transcriptional regulator
MIEIQEILELSQRMLNKIYFREKKPLEYGLGLKLYRAEVHIIEAIGKHPGINVTELATGLGITKGAVSQTLLKLSKKNLVIKNRHNNNDKELALYLSAGGMMVYVLHEDFHKHLFEKFTKEFSDFEQRDFEALKRFFTMMDKHLSKDV